MKRTPIKFFPTVPKWKPSRTIRGMVIDSRHFTIAHNILYVNKKNPQYLHMDEDNFQLTAVSIEQREHQYFDRMIDRNAVVASNNCVRQSASHCPSAVRLPLKPALWKVC